MSKLIENKQMLHIASEVVVLVGLTFFFSQKNKKLMGHIEDLAQRVEEQEDLLQKHEQIIKKLVDTLNRVSQQQFQPVQKQENFVNTTKKKVVPKHQTPPLKNPQRQNISNSRVIFNSPVVEEESSEDEYSEDNEEDNEEELDAEIAEELSELETEDDLKKNK